MASEPSEGRLAGFVPLLGLTLLGAAHELGSRQADAYLGPGLTTPRWVATALVLGGLLLGSFWGRRAVPRSQRRLELLLRLLLSLSLLCSVSGPLWFWAFQTPRALPLVAVLLPLAAGLLAGAGLSGLLRAAGLAYRELGSLRFLLAPLPLGLALLLAVAAAIGLSYAGLWRAGALFGMALAGLALFGRRFADYFSDPQPTRRTPALGALAVGLVSVASAQAFVPARLLARYPAEVVWAADSAELVVISAQNTFELFEAEQLRLSSSDAYRLAELAVHPVLSATEPRRRVLLLGPPGGLFEREVLRHRDVAELWSVSERDATSFRGSLWADAAGGVSADARVRFVVEEPIPWLERQTTSFDCILVSMPLPAGYADGKYYTRFFYELLASKLAPNGALLLQSASQAAMPATFATIASTLTAAGLVATPYEAPVPLLGAVSFVLASRTPRRLSGLPLPEGLRFLNGAVLERALTLGAQAQSPQAQISTLDAQHAVESWHAEQATLGN